MARGTAHALLLRSATSNPDRELVISTWSHAERQVTGFGGTVSVSRECALDLRHENTKYELEESVSCFRGGSNARLISRSHSTLNGTELLQQSRELRPFGVEPRAFDELAPRILITLSP